MSSHRFLYLQKTNIWLGDVSNIYHISMCCYFYVYILNHRLLQLKEMIRIILYLADFDSPVHF